MNKFTLPLLILIISTTFLNAQKKSDLIAENKKLKSELQSTSTLLAESQRDGRINKTKAEDLQAQADQLREANSGLMKNLNNLTQLSQKNSQNVNNALESLKLKELKLRAITDFISSNDSIALSTLTQIKQSMGEGVQVSVTEGAIVITDMMENMFSNGDKAEISETGKASLKKIADILANNPSTTLTIESLGASVDLRTTASWSAVLATILQDEFKVTPAIINISFAEAGFKDEIRFKLHTDFNKFYLKVRGDMSNTK